MLRATVLAIALLLPGRDLLSQKIEVTLQGGIHAARLDRPERRLGFMESTAGEATTMGLRLGGWLSNHVGVEAGAAWSRNHSWQGGTPLPAPTLNTETVFTSVLLRVRPTRADASIAVSAGAGPSLIFHRGNGSSLLTRQTDVGAVVGAAATVRVFSRIGLRVDAQNYLFSSNFAEPHTPPLIGSPVEPAGERTRHEWVILAGATFSLGH